MERRILVVEDSATQAERLQLLLESEGYRVDVAANGREGLERLQQELPDLIISDVVMPEMDGYSLCQAVKSAKRTKRIPVVLLTQQNTPADIIQGLEAGADNFITKPFEEDHLLERLRRIFEHLELRTKGQLDMEVTLRVGGREISITADKQQIIELVFSTLEEVSRLNQQLLLAKQALEDYSRNLEVKVEERTQALRRSMERLETLREIDLSILAAQSPQEIAQAALPHIQHLVPCQRASVVVFDYETREAITVATQDIHQTGVSGIGRGALEDFRIAELQQGKIHVVEDTMSLSRPMPVIQALQAEGVRSYLNVPLIAQAALIGALYVGADSPGAFTAEHMEITQEVANQLAIAILQARLREQVQRHAVQLEQRVAERTADLAAVNEQLAAASRHKSEFLANMSHELRTPLNSILGFSQLLLEQSGNVLSEKQTRYLSHVHNSGKHLLQLISDILDISKVEAGKFGLQPEALPVAETLEDILVIGRGLANKKGQVIETEVEPNLPPLLADPVRFKQILFNLLSNAVKFTPESGRITVTARRIVGEPERGGTGEPGNGGRGDAPAPAPRFPDSPIHREGDFLEIAVADTGVGIRPEDLPRLFREFVQLETTQAQHHDGTGLGLALTKKLVELHGGRIWAASEGEGRGSTFTVVLLFVGPLV